MNASILLEFYQDLEEMTEMGMSDRKPSDVVPRSMPELGKEDVGSWIEFWKENSKETCRKCFIRCTQRLPSKMIYGNKRQ